MAQSAQEIVVFLIIWHLTHLRPLRWYTDDKQVTSLEIEKVYSDTPCVVVYIAEDE